MRKPSWILAIVTAAAGFSAAGVSAQTLSIVPFLDDFEGYTNGTPLVGGTNGWYGSSSNIIVQTNTVYIGTNAAIIPDDCTLSNRFQDVASPNIYMQMDLLPVMYEETNPPVVDTNKAVLLYLNTNGNFVVHDGPTASPSNSTRWVEATQGGVDTNGTNWVSVQIRINYSNQTWGLYNITTNSRLLVTNNIRFVNPNSTNFLGFSVYNGLNASYMDSVTVTNPLITNAYLFVTPNLVTNTVMRGHTANQTVNVANHHDFSNMSWSASITDAWIQIVGLSNGIVAAGSSTNLVVLNSSVTLAAGTYTGTVKVAATSDDTFLDPESAVATLVLQVTDLLSTPVQLTNAVMQGDWASRSFPVWNAGPGVLDYTVTANQPWLGLSRSGGSLTGQTAGATNTIAVAFTNTSLLAVGQYHGLITIVSTNFGGATNTLAVTLDVRAVPMLSVSPALLTNAVMQGQNVASNIVRLWNGSEYYGIGYQVATNGGGAWLSVLATNNYLTPLTTNNLTINYAVSLNASAGDVPSNYTATIIVTATNPSGSAASGSPVSIPVVVQVNPKPRLALSLTNLSQTVLQGQDAVNQSFDIWNASAFYTLEYTVSKGLTPWVVLTPASGTSTGQHARIEVQYSTANLPAGITNAVITVVGRAWDGMNRDNARDATQQIAVKMSVTPFATLTTDARSAYNYIVRKGAPPPDTVFNIWNSGDPRGAMNFTVKVITPSASWLRVTPASGTSMGNMVEIRAQADAAGMKPGVVYSGTVQIDAIDTGSGKPAYGSPIAFTIAMVVRNFKGFDFQGGLSGASDLVLYREANGMWDIRNLLSNYSTNLILGGLGYQAMPGDYTGDGITDLGVYRRASGSWYAQQVGDVGVGVITMKQWAGPEYVGVTGDFDGDGRTDPGVYLEQSGLWMLLLSESGYQQVSGIFGGPGYTALLAGDYDGDAKDDPGIYNRASGLWMLLLSSIHSIVSGTFGGSGFVPVPADYDGDGITDPAIYETATGNWYILMSTTLTSQGYSLSIYHFGGLAMSTTLVPAPGNYDGVGGADLALYDTTTWSWYIMALDGVPLAWGYPMGRLGSLPMLP